MNLNPNTTALVVVDMQNDFAHPDGALYTPASEDIIPTIERLLTTFRNAGSHVIFTRDEHAPDQYDDAHYYNEFDQWGEHVVENTWGAEIVEELQPADREFVVVKDTYDAFHNTNLEQHLENHGIKNLVIVGTLANVCVLHTASSAGLRDYRPILLSDALGYIDEDHREYALDHADWLFGEVKTTDDLTLE